MAPEGIHGYARTLGAIRAGEENLVEPETLLMVAVALVVGFVVAKLMMKNKSSELTDDAAALSSQLEQARSDANESRDSFIRSETQLESAQKQLDQLRVNLDEATHEAKVARESLVQSIAERDAAKDQLEQLKEDRKTLKESMQAISADQLKENREEFLKHAEERLGKTEEKNSIEMTHRHEAIEKQFKGVREKMETFQEIHRKIEEQRIKDFGSLNQQVLGLATQAKAVEEASQSLSTALRGSSQSRGKWGEMSLRNIVEAAGMTEHCDFEEQDQGDSDKRPDMVVYLPGEGRIPIDSKAPYADYERAMEATDREEEMKHLELHGKKMRSTMIDLAKRDYPSIVGGKVDFTVMFIPIESVAAAAFSTQPNLQQEAIENKILIATPVTLIALLKTVGIYWQQEKLAANAQEIWTETSKLHDRLKTFHGHLSRVGKNLSTVVDGYNSAVASFEARVLPKARVIEKLSRKEGLKELPRVETEVRDAATPAVDYNPEQRDAEPPGNDSVPEIEETI